MLKLINFRNSNRARGKGTISASKAEDYSGTEVSLALYQLLLVSVYADEILDSH